MYARGVGHRTLTFGVSGMLWNRSLVMYDKETDSKWSHILGKGMQGPLAGTMLDQIPCVMTDWKTWSKTHPDGSVAMLSRTSREFTRDFYARPEQFVLGIAQGGKARAWGFDALLKQSVVNDVWNAKPVVVLFDAESMTAALFSARVEDKTLTFEMGRDGVKDRETGSTWDVNTGRAVGGNLKGKHLEALPAIVSFRRAWRTFHPDSRE